MSILLWLLATYAFAEQNFHCYTAPNTRAFGYESTYGDCAPPNQEANKRKVICTYQAFCKPTDSKDKPPIKTDKELNGEFEQGILRVSNLVCEGTAEFKDGRLLNLKCPSANECRKSFSYGAVPTPGEDADRFTVSESDVGDGRGTE